MCYILRYKNMLLNTQILQIYRNKFPDGISDAIFRVVWSSHGHGVTEMFNAVGSWPRHLPAILKYAVAWKYSCSYIWNSIWVQTFSGFSSRSSLFAISDPSGKSYLYFIVFPKLFWYTEFSSLNYIFIWRLMHIILLLFYRLRFLLFNCTTTIYRNKY